MTVITCSYKCALCRFFFRKPVTCSRADVNSFTTRQRVLISSCALRTTSHKLFCDVSITFNQIAVHSRFQLNVIINRTYFRLILYIKRQFRDFRHCPDILGGVGVRLSQKELDSHSRFHISDYLFWQLLKFLQISQQTSWFVQRYAVNKPRNLFIPLSVKCLNYRSNLCIFLFGRTVLTPWLYVNG